MLSTSTAETLEPFSDKTILPLTMIIPLYPYEHIQPAPTLCYCHYGDIEDKSGMLNAKITTIIESPSNADERSSGLKRRWTSSVRAECYSGSESTPTRRSPPALDGGCF